MRKDTIPLLYSLGEHLGRGLDELTLTTNATLLSKYAADIAAAGVRRINISLDTIDADTFQSITRRGNIEKVFEGIQAAQDCGLQIKINTVVLKNQNANQLKSMISWAHKHRIDMTLIEVMPLGETGEDRIDQYVPMSVIRESLEKDWTLVNEINTDPQSGPSRYVRVKETGGRLGFITPLTQNFCAGCNRVRITCTGRIYMCLGQDDHIDLRQILRMPKPSESILQDALDRALFKKPEKHNFEINRRKAKPALPRHMSMTGG